jgi:hypothetical protein
VTVHPLEGLYSPLMEGAERWHCSIETEVLTCLASRMASPAVLHDVALIADRHDGPVAEGRDPLELADSGACVQLVPFQFSIANPAAQMSLLAITAVAKSCPEFCGLGTTFRPFTPLRGATAAEILAHAWCACRACSMKAAR